VSDSIAHLISFVLDQESDCVIELTLPKMLEIQSMGVSIVAFIFRSLEARNSRRRVRADVET
jgi:hypothetical protein